MNYQYETDKFLNVLYDNKVNRNPLYLTRGMELQKRMENKRQQLTDVLRLQEWKALSLENDYKEITREQREGYQLIRYEMTFLPELTTPLWVLQPDISNGKTILYCHGHDDFGGKGSFDDYEQNKPYHKWIPLRMVEQGYTVYIPELVAIAFGEVKKHRFVEQEQSWCYANSTALLNLGYNMAGLRVFQIQQLFEQMYENWNLKDIVVYGVSGGGLVDTFFGALEPRLKGIVISNYGASFITSTMAMHHCVDNFIPDLLSVGECSDIMALAAPTPILLSNGISDPIFPMAGVKDTIEQVEVVYKELGCSEKFQYEFFEGVHEVSLEKVFFFLNSVFE